MTAEAFDFDWLVIGSGFGGSVSALRLSEKGFRVGVLEQGGRYEPADLPASAWQTDKYNWLPRLGKLGIIRTSMFRHVFFPSQNGVGGGSLVYGGVLYRAKKEFFDADQWSHLGDWEHLLAPHYTTAERMLGAAPVPFDSMHQQWIREMGRHFGTEDTVTRAPTGVFFGEPGKTVPDPYFGGTSPDRTGCTRCGACMVGCRVGAVNSLTKNYLWFAERNGVQILPNIRSSTSLRWAAPTAATATGSPPNIPAAGVTATAAPTPPPGWCSPAARWAPTNCSPPASTAARCPASATGSANWCAPTANAGCGSLRRASIRPFAAAFASSTEPAIAK